MKPRLLFVALILCSASVVSASPRDAAWQRVQDARTKGLPKSAAEALGAVIPLAIADRAYGEAARAITEKIVLEEDKPEPRIRKLQPEIDRAPTAIKPILEAVLAQWYWEYFQQHRWQFAQRTATAGSASNDLETWDLGRILTEIDRHFSAALANEATLKTTPVSAFNDLILVGTVPDDYRPTLYDFIVHQALEFYQLGEQGPVRGEDEAEIAASSPILDDADAFLRWQPPATGGGALKLKAVALYQNLLRFHEHDTNRSAFYDANFSRLKFGYSASVGEDKETRYRGALERFIASTKDHPISSHARATLATLLKTQQDLVSAHRIATEGAEAFPESAGAAACRNVIAEIEAKSVRMATEYVWSAPWPTLSVNYRNVSQVYFRAVRVDWSNHIAKSRWNGGFTRDDVQELLRQPAAYDWTATLAPTPDYAEHAAELPAPQTLRPGFYAIVASATADFALDDNWLSTTGVWVSDLAILLRNANGNGATTGLLLEANSGQPVPNATIRVWRRNRQGALAPAPSVETDGDGAFAVPAGERSVMLLAEAGRQAVATRNEFYNGRTENEAEANRGVVFFTDRALYRPGQTIAYKGVGLSFDRAAGKYGVRKAKALTVILSDGNGREIARAEQRTNDFGSFHGMFTAPRGRLTGSMMLRVEGEPGGAEIQVEEYKRPKFEVELNAPTNAPKLGETIEVPGKALAYSGASLGGAKVVWRVERQVQMPYWCWWIALPQTKAIAHGTTTMESDGTFRISFPATPDTAIAAKNEPTFAFHVHADITDSTGETRSQERVVNIGYSALRASVEANDWQTPERPVEFTITTHSLDDDPQVAEGEVAIRALKQPEAIRRASLDRFRVRWINGVAQQTPDESLPETWDEGDVVTRMSFKTGADGKAIARALLPAGVYRASLETRDRFGNQATARQVVYVVAPQAERFPVKIPHRVAAPKWSVEPGETFTALWGTGYAAGRALVEIECAGKSLQRFWTDPARTQVTLSQPVTEEMRGGFAVRFTFVRENRAYTEERIVEVPWTNKELTVKWARFHSKLSPGDKELWTATVSGPKATAAAAEMVATLYDASLDQFYPHQWPTGFGVLRHEAAPAPFDFQNVAIGLEPISDWMRRVEDSDWRYRRFVPEIEVNARNTDMLVLSAFEVRTTNADAGYYASASLAGTGRPARPNPSATLLGPQQRGFGDDDSVVPSDMAISVKQEAPPPDLNRVSARKNLNETAFFFPTLRRDDEGTVRIEFTVPDALTRWRFMGFAHDTELRSGLLTDTATTSKSLMVEPNAPRFVREGDTIEFTVKVSNLSNEVQSGTIQLTFADASTLASADAALGNRNAVQGFTLAPKESRSLAWRIVVPDGMGFLTYKAVAASDKFSDGEEGALPVLSRRVLVTESLPLPIRGPTKKTFEFTRLLNSGASPTLRHESLTVEMVSQPAWYAVLALPYLMEYPYECSEQIFNRYYANALARHIATSSPKIRRIFDQWRNTPAVDSPLEKNEDLKAVMLEETPWVRAAKHESEARRNVGVLFEDNRLEAEAAHALQTLNDRQLSDGLWAWFPGGHSSEYISLYIMTGFGRLRNVGVEADMAPAIKCLDGLDRWMAEHYARIKTSKQPSDYVPSYLDALYLYGRSFFLVDRAIASANREAIDFFLAQSRQHWLKVGSRQSQAHLALALDRFGDKETAQAIMRSLKERSRVDTEMGRYWDDNRDSWWWYHAPIETQALMIEAFDAVAHDADAVEGCKVWLLKQKQTQAWRTTKGTADAVYALLLRGDDLLGSDARVAVSLAGMPIKPDRIEAGTGYFEKRFVGAEIKPEMGRVTVEKTDAGVSWGSLHWQYLEDVAKITPHEGTALKLKKSLFVKTTTAQGPVLTPVTSAVAVGDELVVRIELRTDRDLEFVHLKDQRGSGTEPVNVLSEYKYQDGLGYYESTRDTATHFFFDYVRAGVYVFEYSTRVQLKGRYQSGVAEIQCMYAPEFNSHSESVAIEVGGPGGRQ